MGNSRLYYKKTPKWEFFVLISISQKLLYGDQFQMIFAIGRKSQIFLLFLMIVVIIKQSVFYLYYLLCIDGDKKN